ncbi:hypothetical protein ASG36_18705 [Geodermatophilus sp. Leaf369]|uniref:hypothetical protein n=1 Tax=Geodermatophilus sp. Leaf369 TaxID=1736354 RepID=UPI0006F482F7|nr:hypothetical protein [Geodermatophilus sp. Leaf369]KQS57018.1 hypothetical protein ASG36_18705 [Geodermatophilus sp. Leaf369]
MRTRLLAAVLGAGLVLTACAEQSSGSPAPRVQLPVGADDLVLRIAYTGGYVTPTTTVSRLPLVAVYRDGRVFTEGPVTAIYPGPAWPNVQVGQLDEAQVQRIAEAAMDAGVADTADLGSPGIADAPTTVFTLATAEETFTREVYALREGTSGPGVTPEQQDARVALSELLDELTSSQDPTTAYEPTAVAAIAEPYLPPEDATLTRDPVAWPGPALPGDPVGPGIGCVVAGSEVTAAAQAADTLTPWTSEGQTWTVTFRPLLPDETGCADLG